MNRLQGVAAAPGVVRGPWVHIETTAGPVVGRIAQDAAPAEVDRLRGAAEAAAVELERIAQRVRDDGHGDEAAIFEAQASIARDPALATMAAERIERDAEDGVAAIGGAADSFAEQLRSLDDETLSARATDVVDVGRRIARRLSGEPDAPATLDEAAIVVADDLPPSVTAMLPRDRLLGIALEGSSPTAHAAILARAYGIPAVVGASGLLRTLRPDGGPRAVEELAIDGGSGEIILDPDAATRTRMDARADAGRQRHAMDVRAAAQPAVTRDGTAIAVLANIGTPDESDPAIELGAQGVGLFRTEFLFRARSGPPSEDEQVSAYERVVRAFAPRPVTIRLLDVGGDKPIPYLPIDPEMNPFLGVRALRLAFDDPGLFITQLRACYRAAAAGPLKVMAPMVADLGDVELLLRLADQARTELTAEGHPIGDVELGVMLEIPSSVLVADAYFGRIRFASLGTNDLLQYTLAVDRGNAALERYRDPLHPGVLRLIAMAVGAADRAGIELSVCGEMAGDPASALALVGLGIRTLSMVAPSLPAVRQQIRGVSLDGSVAAARAALDDRSAAEARARFEGLLRADDDR